MNTFLLFITILMLVLQNLTYIGCMLYLSGEYTLKSLLPPPRKTTVIIYFI